ncbi:DUF6364 family protein [Dyadobacter sp. NIV53]|uniref:DUF6364 family protein n=1 Tax=Dyadobacter sp. NIV53 TaxID=2861765 RepID=UPI001C87D82A|nr:DUF6364 family protein [Dyadobacter sp. NIV53]
MKTRLNITIEGALLSNVKKYAASKEISVSQIVEDYFRSLIKPDFKKKSIIDLVNQLETPHQINKELDLKKSFYEDNSEKYGF